MKLKFSERSKTPSEVAEENIDIDVTPVMNMFVVLIPFLISMAVFTHLAVHQFTLPANAGSDLDQSKGPVTLKTTVVVHNDFALVTRGGKELDSIPRRSDSLFTELLKKSLSVIIESDSTAKKVIVSVKDSVPFERVVSVMDICRESGFKSVGIASAETESE